MASTKYTLNGTYQLVNAGSATIQKSTKGYGAAMIYFGIAVPSDDTDSFLVDSTNPHYFETANNIYARTPHGVSVDIIVGA